MREQSFFIRVAERVAGGVSRRQVKAVVREVEEQWGLDIDEAQVSMALGEAVKSGRPYALDVHGKQVIFSILHGTVQVRTSGLPALAIG